MQPNGNDSQSIRELLKLASPPDVLDTIAHLSNDEVFTPPRVANHVLNLLPDHIWSDANIKFLDPCVKTGVFLREIVKRLMHGLSQVIPDEETRRAHIMRNMVYGIAITELTSLMSRRTVYCSSDATREQNLQFPENCFSAVKFTNREGNIAFPDTDHKYGTDGKCLICGANKGALDGENRSGRENFAYPFIHRNIQEIFGTMQFDVVIGNPPYQLKDGGHGASASPIYQLFVQQAKALNPKYLSMIIPARWYSGGKGLDSFRHEMLTDRGMDVIVDIHDAAECFPGVEIKGGICYFLRTNSKDDLCEVRTFSKGSIVSSEKRSLNEFDVLIRRNESVSILRKVLAKADSFIEDNVYSRKPFGLNTNYSGHYDKPKKNSIKLYGRELVAWMDRDDVVIGHDLIDKYKILVSVAYNGGDSIPHQITGSPIIAAPGSCATETYLVIGDFEDEFLANNYANYVKTKFFRYMVSLRKITQHISRDRFSFVPTMDNTVSWDDASLYEHFSLSDSEIAVIESAIKEMK